MKIRNGKGKYAVRKAISPIIATVLIIAVTLIAAVAIGGFVFGIFGTASQSAQVAVTGVALPEADFGTSGSYTPTCDTTSTAGNAYLTLTNTGTSATKVTGVTITWAGQSNSFATPATCSIGAAGSTTATLYVTIGTSTTAGLIGTPAVTGQTFSGTATLSNGAQVIFTGTWQ